MTATKLKLTPEALERRRTEALGAALYRLGADAVVCSFFDDKGPTDEELDAIADACNEILNGIDEWLDDREDARFALKHAGKKPLKEGDRVRIGKATLKVIDEGRRIPSSLGGRRSFAGKKRARKPSNKKKGARR